MAQLAKKQTRWYKKSTYDGLDKSTIPVGTEVHVTGALTLDELDSSVKNYVDTAIDTAIKTALNTPV